MEKDSGEAFMNIREAFRAKPAAPRKGLMIDLVNYPVTADNPVEFWAVRVYRNNFSTFSAESQVALHRWIEDVIKSLRLIEPNLFLEVLEEPI
jgi:hypothetical protein